MADANVGRWRFASLHALQEVIDVVRVRLRVDDLWNFDPFEQLGGLAMMPPR